MPAYVIASVRSAHDQEALVEYRARNSEAVADHGGRFLARGGAIEVLEGEWDPKRVVVMEFDDMDTARRWYGSDAYQAAIPIRRGASETDIILVEGA